MKQHITPEQLNELSKRAYKKLDKWMSSHGYWTSTMVVWGPNIGQMIEFLNWENEPLKMTEFLALFIDDRQHGKDIGLCDALWEAVKEVLEK